MGGGVRGYSGKEGEGGGGRGTLVRRGRCQCQCWKQMMRSFLYI